MRIVTNTAAAALVFLAALAPAPTARAGIADDILDVAEQARDRAAQARNRAAEARDSANETRDQVREGVAHLTGDLQMFIDQSVEDLKATLQLQWGIEGRDEFLGDDGCSATCEQFRSEIVDLVYNLEDLINSALDAADAGGGPIDLQWLVNMVEMLQGRALFPMYRLLAVQTDLLNEMNTQLPVATDDLVTLIDLINGPPVGYDGDDVIENEMRSCQLMLDHQRLVKGALAGAQAAGSLLKLAGKLCMGTGENEAEFTVGVVGVVQGTIQIDPPGGFGQTLDGLSDTLFRITSNATEKYRFCVNLKGEQEIIANQMRILEALGAN